MTGSIYNRFRRITTNQVYLPEIDGIRFLAILLVVLFHIHGYFVAKTPIIFADNQNEYNLLNTFLGNGNRGVEIFFVLSGFILCLPFANHYINTEKKVSLSRYYLRRLTRLEPPYFIAMTAVLLMQLMMHIHPASVLVPSWLASLIYSHNIIFHHKSLLTTVAWSLEIEIQFYLIAPLLFSVLSLNKIARRALLVAAYTILLLFQKWYHPPFASLYGFAQYFLAGILLADVYVSNNTSGFFNKKWSALFAVLCFAVIIFMPFYHLPAIRGLSFLSRFCFPLTIALFFYVVLKNDSVKNLFSYKFIPVIGGMCYSIYLLHYTIISVVGRYTTGIHFTSYYLPNLILQVILLSIPILIISAAFYYFIERPFMSGKWVNMLLKKEHKEDRPAPINQ